MPKRIAARDLHATGFEHEHARSDFSGHEQRLIFSVALHLTEAEEPVDFRGSEFWKHPFVARIDFRHAPSSRGGNNPIQKSATSVHRERTSQSRYYAAGPQLRLDLTIEERGVSIEAKMSARSSTSFQAQAAHFRLSPDSGHIAASRRSATKSADARRGAALGVELRQDARAAALVAAR